MDKNDKLRKKYRLPWQLLNAAFGGKSIVDTRFMPIQSIEDANDLIRAYGYNPALQSDRTLLLDTLHRALEFIQKEFIDPFDDQLKIPDEITSLRDLGQFVYMTNARKSERKLHLWACAALKVLHTILHLENDPLIEYFQEARRQIFERFHGHLHIDNQERVYIGTTASRAIPLHFFEVKREKNWNSRLLKLLYKPDNTAARIYDRIGVRIVTNCFVDLLLVFNYLLVSKIFVFANLAPGRSRNTLIDLCAIQKSLNAHLHRYSKGEINSEDLEKVLRCFQREEFLQKQPGGTNALSLEGYRSVQFTCRHLVRFANPTYSRLYDLRQHMYMEKTPLNAIDELDQILASTKRQIEFFFPFEIQLMDREAFLENRYGTGSHQEYKHKQILMARKRVMGALLPVDSSN